MEENKSSMQNNEKAVGKTYEFLQKTVDKLAKNDKLKISRTKKDFSPFRANIIRYDTKELLNINK